MCKCMHILYMYNFLCIYSLNSNHVTLTQRFCIASASRTPTTRMMTRRMKDAIFGFRTGKGMMLLSTTLRQKSHSDHMAWRFAKECLMKGNEERKGKERKDLKKMKCRLEQIWKGSDAKFVRSRGRDRARALGTTSRGRDNLIHFGGLV